MRRTRVNKAIELLKIQALWAKEYKQEALKYVADTERTVEFGTGYIPLFFVVFDSLIKLVNPSIEWGVFSLLSIGFFALTLIIHWALRGVEYYINRAAMDATNTAIAEGRQLKIKEDLTEEDVTGVGDNLIKGRWIKFIPFQTKAQIVNIGILALGLLFRGLSVL